MNAEPSRDTVQPQTWRQACPRHRRTSASEHETLEGYEGHFEHFDGGWTVGFERYTQDADLAPLFAGLPHDECQCPHMGYVISGKLAFRSADGEEVFEAGDAYYVGPGHTPVLFAGTEVVEFSPTEELGRTFEVVARNMEKLETATLLRRQAPAASRLAKSMNARAAGGALRSRRQTSATGSRSGGLEAADLERGPFERGERARQDRRGEAAGGERAQEERVAALEREAQRLAGVARRAARAWW